MASFQEDTRSTKEEFEGLSNSTQILIWSMVAIGVLIGVLLGGAIAYGVVVEEVEGRDCIQYESDVYCTGEEAAEVEAEDSESEEGIEGEVGGD